MKNGFNSIAGIYDQLADLIFGVEWQSIQQAPGLSIGGKKSVLIVGGGSGRILETFHTGQKLTYVELSSKMLSKAEKRSYRGTVDFVHQDYLTWTSDARFDAIVFPFFLDSFQKDHLGGILSKAKKELKADGELHVIDFQRGSAIQNFWIWLMYRLFCLTVNLEGNRLLDIFGNIRSIGFYSISETQYLKNWVSYQVFRRK